MKNFFLIVLITVTYILPAQTHVYHPFPENNAVWNIEYGFQCWLPPYDYGGANYSITFSNDTVIGGLSYHKLIVPFMPSGTSACESGKAFVNVYKAAIRQDVAARKVFIVPTANNTEQLLYDFNMQVGDTLKGYLSCNNRTRVKSIDSVLVGITYRKRWLIEGYTPIYLIEGVGFTYGLFEGYPCATDQPDYDITCFSQNGQNLYNPSPYTIKNCALITSVNTPDNILNRRINIYPNPASDKVNLAIHLEQDQTGMLVVYDITAKVILSQKLIGSSDLHEMNIKILSEGLYIYKLNVNDNTVSSGKLSIIR